MCISIFIIIEEMAMLSKMILRFQNCYKSVILNFFDYTNWTGDEAVFFDKCVQSTKNEILMVDTSYGPYEYGLFGNPYKDQLEAGIDCEGATINYALKGSPISNMLFSNFLSYTMHQLNAGNKQLGKFEL